MRTAVGERNFQGGKRTKIGTLQCKTYSKKKKKKSFLKHTSNLEFRRNFSVQIEKYEGSLQGLAKNEI